MDAEDKKSKIDDVKKMIDKNITYREDLAIQQYIKAMTVIEEDNNLALEKLLVAEYQLGMIEEVKPNGEVVRAKSEEPTTSTDDKKEKFEDAEFKPTKSKRKQEILQDIPSVSLSREFDICKS